MATLLHLLTTVQCSFGTRRGDRTKVIKSKHVELLSCQFLKPAYCELQRHHRKTNKMLAGLGYHAILVCVIFVSVSRHETVTCYQLAEDALIKTEYRNQSHYDCNRPDTGRKLVL